MDSLKHCQFEIPRKILCAFTCIYRVVPDGHALKDGLLEFEIPRKICTCTFTCVYTVVVVHVLHVLVVSVEINQWTVQIWEGFHPAYIMV